MGVARSSTALTRSTSSASSLATDDERQTVPMASVRPEVEITSEVIRGAASEAGATRDQMMFLEAWCSTIFDEAAPRADQLGKSIVVCTQLRYMEVSITSETQMMSDLIRYFVASCGILDVRMLDSMQQLLDEIEASNAGKLVQSLTLWCRLKNLGGDGAAADAGFAIAAELEWIVADLLMPPCKDQALFREHAEQELLKPCVYRSSVFPVEPERSLTLEMRGAPKKALLTALFFFKSLGLTKPEDATVSLLGTAPANTCSLTVFMGPKGLTRVRLRLHGPRRKIAEELAGTCFHGGYNAKVLDMLAEAVHAKQPDIVDYVAMAAGYTVAVGFTATV